MLVYRTIKQTFLFCLSLLLLTHTPVVDAARVAPPAAENPFAGLDPNMSQEELLEQFMSEINQLIPEEEREKFWEEVAKETERLEKETAHMNDEEKEKYLMGIITQPGAQVPEQPTLPVAPPTPVVEEPIKKPTTKPIGAEDKVTEVVNIINSIVRSIESLLNKSAALPDFDGKIERWIRSKRINDWPTGTSWVAFQQQLSYFVHVLQRIKEKDPKIGYKHIEAIIEQEELLNNLRQLETRLALNVPNIEVSVFAMAKMSAASKTAINKSINALAEALYKLKLPEDLIKLMEKFEPIAKKIREEEAKMAQQATIPHARARAEVPTKVYGKREQPKRLPSLADYGIKDGSRNARSDAPSSKARASAPAAKDEKKVAPSSSGGKRGGGGGGGRIGGGSSSKGKDEKAKDTKMSAPKKASEPARRSSPGTTTKKVEQDPDVKRNVGDFGKNLQDAANALESGIENYTEDALRRHFAS